MNKLCLPYNGMHSSSDMTEPQKRENPTYITRSDRRQWMLSCLGCVLLFVTLWTVAHQAPLSMKFSRQEHWSGLPCPPPGDLPNSGTEPLFLPSLGFPGDTRGKEPTCQCRRHKRWAFDPWVGKIPWRRRGQPTLVFLCGKSHGQRRLVGYSPWSCKELNMTWPLNNNKFLLSQWSPSKRLHSDPLWVPLGLFLGAA